MFNIFNPEFLLTVTHPKETTEKDRRMDIKICGAVIFMIMEKLEKQCKLMEDAVMCKK